MPKVRTLLAASFLAIATTTVAAPAATRPVTVQGQLLDVTCYSAQHALGRAHGSTCGKACLKSGLPAGVLVHGHAFILLTNPRPLADYVGLTVKVVGREDAADHTIFPKQIFRRMGAKWISVKLHDNFHH